jgi:uncharacterized membrane protein YgcG
LVTTGGTSYFDESFIGGFLKLGGGIGANGIGVHPYGIQNLSGDFMDQLVALRSSIGQYLSPAPPVWDTEWGFSSTDYSSPVGNGADPTARFVQATQVPERILTSCAAGSPIYIYYDLRDDGTDPTNREHNFGLIANDYSEKPALVAVQALAAVARNRTYAGLIHTAPSSLVAMRFDGATDQVYAVWASVPKSNVTITFPTTATATDLFGSPLMPQHLNGRLAMTVEEGAGPVYITIPSIQPAAPAPVSGSTTNAGSSSISSTSASSSDSSGSSGAGGGGGAPSLWFYGALSMLTSTRAFIRRQRGARRA